MTLRKILASEGLTKTAGRVTREGVSDTGRYVLSPYVTFEPGEKQTAVNFLRRELDSFKVREAGTRSISMYHYTDVDEGEAQRIGWVIWTRIVAAAKRGSITNGGITMIPLEWLAKKGIKLRSLKPVSRMARTSNALISASKLRNKVKRAVLSLGGYTVETARLYKVPEFTKYEDFQRLGLTVKSTDPTLRSMNKKVVTDFSKKLAQKVGLPITDGPRFVRDPWSSGWRVQFGEGRNKVTLSAEPGGQMSPQLKRYYEKHPDERESYEELEWGHNFDIIVLGPKKAAPLTIPYYD